MRVPIRPTVGCFLLSASVLAAVQAPGLVAGDGNDGARVVSSAQPSLAGAERTGGSRASAIGPRIEVTARLATARAVAAQASGAAHGAEAERQANEQRQAVATMEAAKAQQAAEESRTAAHHQAVAGWEAAERRHAAAAWEAAERRHAVAAGEAAAHREAVAAWERAARRRPAAPAAAPARSRAAAPASAPAERPPVRRQSGGLVSVKGIVVDASIAGNLQDLLAAASAAGIDLGGSGYRDPAAQRRLRQLHCPDPVRSPASACSPATAKPGQSMHEKGLAIDFTYRGSTIESRGSAAFRWLAANAARYGLRNLPSEPWHWSVNGQ